MNKHAQSAIRKVRMPAPIESHSPRSNQSESMAAEYQSKFPPISTRPLSSLSYSEKRDCISDIMALGSLRAFDAAHRHQAEIMEKDFNRQWKDQERYRKWKTRQSQSRISTRRKDRDRGVLESIVSQRNQKRRDFIASGVPPDSVPLYMTRHPLPKEDRAIYTRPNHVFFWG
ncbi:hypothetical protein TRFO_21838 [Tritrichomonas foetus]|uniref:Uncharacterized protein n=1 Tax=Tritrichomonas foetus TaxID=1144522 RepID=A0A1J4KHH2_9EUKA|nr:hypothetical protein TRFO_21838 [Tritrichomonas foetus]|eukprot:OHT09276.1 hypothetical protein TRFO_21838 [Tritrichomonas foetus]